MIVISKKKGEPKDNMFRKFSKMFKEEDIVYEVNRKMFYKKDSLLKKEKDRDKIKKRIMLKNYGKNVYRNKT
jgi:ribosomal protein S21